ncbi:hypothetical protein AB0D99_10530 [Streptomyces sp. NPDC047971]|uniref:hypothetical protein n=1 Tax=Streptomyces sp. NPDC047971 TaxID=3154499 RepID=UPI0033C25FAD
MDSLPPPVTDDYPDPTRLPLISLYEAREAMELLLHFADDTSEGWAAGELARVLAARLPTEE